MRVAFAIHKIGLIFPYEPRPGNILVLETIGAFSRYPGMWSAELPYHSTKDTGVSRRSARKHIHYGEALPGWTVAQSAKPLAPEGEYHVIIRDGGRSGSDTFGPARLPRCV